MKLALVSLFLLTSTGCGSCAEQRKQPSEDETQTQNQSEAVNPANTKVRSHPPSIGHAPRGAIYPHDAEPE